jgi:AcrR family transcriptional regulator
VSSTENRAPSEGEGLPRLPHGRHGLPREFVVRNQRERLEAGIIASVAERGYHHTTIVDIAAASGISKRTFYDYFADKEACFLATYEMVAEFLLGAMDEEGAAEKGWAARVRAELEALLAVFAANPDLARFMLAAPPAAGGKIAERYYGFLDELIGRLVAGRPGNTRRPTEAAEHGIAGGFAGLIVERVSSADGEDLTELLPDLLELVLTPYLGRERAIKQARRG